MSRAHACLTALVALAALVAIPGARTADAGYARDCACHGELPQYGGCVIDGEMVEPSERPAGASPCALCIPSRSKCSLSFRPAGFEVEERRLASDFPCMRFFDPATGRTIADNETIAYVRTCRADGSLSPVKAPIRADGLIGDALPEGTLCGEPNGCAVALCNRHGACVQNVPAPRGLRCEVLREPLAHADRAEIDLFNKRPPHYDRNGLVLDMRPRERNEYYIGCKRHVGEFTCDGLTTECGSGLLAPAGTRCVDTNIPFFLQQRWQQGAPWTCTADGRCVKGGPLDPAQTQRGGIPDAISGAIFALFFVFAPLFGLFGTLIICCCGTQL